MSIVLAFDCAVSGQGIAIVRDGIALASLFEEGRDQAARLLPGVAAALAEARVAKAELDLVAVTVGPGSFTGVRVGLSAARGLAVGLGLPLAGIATTAVLQAQAPASDRTVVAAIDTKLGDWFCAIGDDPAPFAARAEDLAARLAGQKSVIVGKDVAPLLESLQAAGIDAMAEEGPPDPVVLGRLALGAGVDVWSARNRAEGLPRPLYLRGVNITLPDGARRTVEWMGEGFLLEPVRALDLDRASHLHRAAFEPMGERGWSRADIAGLLASPGVTGFLLTEAGADIGMAICRVVAGEAELLAIAVESARRRRGAARRLLGAIVEKVRGEGAGTLFLEVGADNPAARALYGAMGFETVGRRAAYYPRPDGSAADALVMRLTLI